MKIFAPLVLAAAAAPLASAQVQVGDTICVEGFVMDKFCIDNIVLLDNGRLETLQYPDEHTIHCLVDVAVCRQSDFEVLTPPPQGSDVYQRGWRVTQQSKRLLIDEARKVGDPDNYCRTCEDGGLEQTGFRATIKATVQAVADEENDIPPVIVVEEAFTSRTTDPDTLESTMISDNPCQYYFGMEDFSEASVIDAPPPTDAPTSAPTGVPTSAPTSAPTGVPTSTPTGSPTDAPVAPPTDAPATPATDVPVTISNVPSDMPSDMPSTMPSEMPVQAPTRTSLTFTERPTAAAVPLSNNEPNVAAANGVPDSSTSTQSTLLALAGAGLLMAILF